VREAAEKVKREIGHPYAQFSRVISQFDADIQRITCAVRYL